MIDNIYIVAFFEPKIIHRAICTKNSSMEIILLEKRL